MAEKQTLLESTQKDKNTSQPTLSSGSTNSTSPAQPELTSSLGDKKQVTVEKTITVDGKTKVVSETTIVTTDGVKKTNKSTVFSPDDQDLHATDQKRLAKNIIKTPQGPQEVSEVGISAEQQATLNSAVNGGSATKPYLLGVGDGGAELTPQVAQQDVMSGPPDKSTKFSVSNYANKIKEQVRTGVSASIQSLNPLKIQPKVLTGARAVLKINGLVVGYANSISYTINTEWVELSGIDDDYPNELAPGMCRVSGSINIFRVPNHGAAQEWWQSDMMRGRVWPYSIIEVRDSKSDNLIVQFPRIAITQRSESIQAGQATITQLSFISIGYRDELSPQPCDEPVESTGLISQGKKIGNAAKNGANKLMSKF